MHQLPQVTPTTEALRHLVSALTSVTCAELIVMRLEGPHSDAVKRLRGIYDLLVSEHRQLILRAAEKEAARG